MTLLGKLAALLCFCTFAYCHAAPPVEGRQQLIGVVESTGKSLKDRIAAAEKLSAIKLPAELKLVKVMQEASQDLQRVLALQLAKSPQGAAVLLASIEQGKASSRLLEQTAIRSALERARLPGLKKRLEEMTENLQAVDEEVPPLISQRRQGFVKAASSSARGKMLFQKHCVGCHRVTSEGAKVGPELKGIGHRGLDRLLEDLLDPHCNVDPNFRRTTVVTTGGEILSGLLIRGKGTKRLLIDQQGKERKLDVAEIDEAIVSPLSAMPTGLAGHLKATEFYDLMAYLLSLRATASPPQKPVKK